MFVRLSFILLALQVVVGRQAACSDSSERLYDLITNHKDLDTEEGLTFLDELRQFNFPIDASDLQKLLSLAGTNTNTCSYRSYLDLYSMEVKYAEHKDSIVALIRKFLWAKFKECKKGYEENVVKAVSALDPQVERKVDQLCNVNDGRFRDLYDDQVKRIFRYMSKNETNLDLDLLKDKNKFFKRFEDTMGDTCLPYLENLYNEFHVYELMLPSEDPENKKTAEQLAEVLISNVPNGIALLWIIKARMCILVMDDMALFSEAVRKELKKESIKRRGGAWNVFFARICGKDKKKPAN